MDVTNFIGDFESIENLLQHPETKPGDSAYIVNGGHLYIAVGTKAGMDWKRLKVGKGSRGHRQTETQDLKVNQVSQVQEDQGEAGLNGRDGSTEETVSMGKTDVMEHPDGMLAVCKDGQPGEDGKDGEPGKGWDNVTRDPGTGRFLFVSRLPGVELLVSSSHIPFFISRWKKSQTNSSPTCNQCHPTRHLHTSQRALNALNQAMKRTLNASSNEHSVRFVRFDPLRFDPQKGPLRSSELRASEPEQ